MTVSKSPADKTPRRCRNPPIEHRFRKGVSGNPKGRPRKTRVQSNIKIGGKPSVGFDQIKLLAIKEGYRMIKIREGDRVEKVPVIQAILRKLAVAAANGNTRAQQSYVNLLIGAEADQRMETEELLKAAIEYKDNWYRVLAERARTGATGPEPVPHPDDVIIDYETRKVRFDGPIDEEQKAAQEWLRAELPQFVRKLTQVNEQLESDPRNSELRKKRRDLEKMAKWFYDDAFQQAVKRTMRDALRPIPGKSRKD
jgi:Family of unknown function (DUF5681)